jgi:phosphoglycerate dehydrogenase-like enzyme
VNRPRERPAADGELVLITHPDPAALAREIEALLGEPIRWCRLDAPGAAEAGVWFCAGPLPEAPLRLPRLRWIHTGWAGVETWFRRAEWSLDVTLTRTVGDYPSRMAQYVFGYLLARLLDVPEALRQMEGRAWRRWAPGSLEGKHLLVVGLGAIGSAVGDVGRALGMEIEGVRRGAPTDAERARGVRGPGELPGCLARADVVVNLLPLSAETEGFWTAERFAALGEGVTFINVSRGLTVDDKALREGLRRGRPAFAILDAFQEEPLPPDHPFRRDPRIWITPHIAGIGTVPMMARAFVENWRRYRSGEALLHVVDRSRGY